MNNSAVIAQFYKSFQRGDAEGMIRLYDENVKFSDPAFGELRGAEVGAMWTMLLSKKDSDLTVEYSNVNADESSGQAEWTATYKYGPKKRRIVNNIKSKFEILDGKILKQTDYFDLWAWSRQALGPLGYLLGWTPFFQNKVRRIARKSLNAFMKKSMGTPLKALVFFLFLSLSTVAQDKPLKIGIAGLTHTHVHWILGREDLGDIEIVGISEPNRELAKRYAEQHGFPMSLVFDSLEKMIDSTKPEAVTAFGNIFDHLKIVETCAPQGIHVMVEKPMAVNLEHARKMKALADLHGIELLTNYETSWYPTNHTAYDWLKKDSIGELRKLVVRDGHRGPKKIGINSEFLEWLTDPVLNGGGAITDFGCYGINLMTWMMHGEKPLSVTAVTQQQQPENNPKVDDDATLILRYENCNAIIQASWDWPIGRKDMEVYGLRGVIYADNRNDLRIRIAEGYDGYRENQYRLEEMESPMNDPFSYLKAVIRKELRPEPFDLYSIENNMLVMEILSAAIESANSGRTIYLSDTKN